MKRKLNLLLLFRARKHQLACRIAASCNSPADDTARRPDTCGAILGGVADARFTCAHLTSGPKNPQMFARKTTDKPALHLCVECVTARISKSDIIGAALKK